MKGLIKTRLLILFFSLVPLVAQAETLVLVPGFQQQGMDWRFRHVTSSLQSSGWVDGGNLQLSPQGIRNSTPPPPTRPANILYTLDLPTHSSMQQQAAVLDQYLRQIAQVRQEPLILVGHSAGGIVARQWLVSHNSVPVHTLVTIATPHLGTPWAEISEAVMNTPLAEFVAGMGIRLPNAKAIYQQLREEKPGTYLYWLNHQRHPAIRYISLVRDSQQPDQVDFMVPPHSQDMNKVFALNGKAESWASDGSHFLEADDGYRIMQALAKPRRY